VETEMSRRFSLLQRLIADYIISDETIFRIVGDSIEKLAEQISESIYVRTAISQAIQQIPETMESQAQSSAVSGFVNLLNERLDFRAILIGRLSALSNEAIEQLVMDTAGTEIRAIVWFGAGIGLIVGIAQTLINFI